MDESPSIAERRLARIKIDCLWLIPLLEEFWVLALIVLPTRSAAYWIRLGLGLMVLFLILQWCRADAEQRHFRWPNGMSLLIVALALIGVPYYLVRSRGGHAWIGLAWLVLYCLGLVLLLILNGALLVLLRVRMSP